MLVPCPPPWGGVGGGCHAPSLWEGWGGLQGRRVLTVVVNTAWKAKTSQPKATPWELFATNIRPEWAKELLFHPPLCHSLMVGCHSFAPFGAYPCCSQFPGRCPGLAYQCPLRGVNLTLIPTPDPIPERSSPTRSLSSTSEATSSITPREGRQKPTPLFLTEGQKDRILPPFGRAGVGFPSSPSGGPGWASPSSLREGRGGFSIIPSGRPGWASPSSLRKGYG